MFANIESYISQLPPAHHNDASAFLDPQEQAFQNEEIRVTPFFISSRGESITNYIVQPSKMPGKMLNERLKAFGVKGAAISELVKNGRITINGREVLL